MNSNYADAFMNMITDSFETSPEIMWPVFIVAFLIIAEAVFIGMIREEKLKEGENINFKSNTIKLLSLVLSIYIITLCLGIFVIFLIIIENWKPILMGLGIIAVIIIYFKANQKVASKLIHRETKEEAKERIEKQEKRLKGKMKKYGLKFKPGEKVRIVNELDSSFIRNGFSKGDIVTIDGFYNKSEKEYTLKEFGSGHYFSQDLFAKIKPKKRKSKK